MSTALAASTHLGSSNPAEIAPGARADLVVCESDPVTVGEHELRSMRVAATLLDGRLTHLG
jgi:predicted amidohydrolase YtcJ